MKNKTLSILFVLIILQLGSPIKGKTNVDEYFAQKYESKKTALKVSVENVRISKDYSNAWGVKGSIRNNTTRSIKGAVKIKFLNSRGDIVHSSRAYVNGGDFFSPGQSAVFEYFVSPQTFYDVVDFDIEFYEF